MPLDLVLGQVFAALAGRRWCRPHQNALSGCHSLISFAILAALTLAALTVVADPSLPDPEWIAGIYEGADADDLAGTLEVEGPPDAAVDRHPGHSDVRWAWLRRPHQTEHQRAAFSTAFRIRPPPAR